MPVHRPNNTKNFDWISLLESYSTHVSKEDTVVEIGSSVSDRTQMLAAKCKQLIGVELFPDRLPEGRNNIEYRQGDWQKLSEVVGAGSVDLLIGSHVIEHVRDDLKALNETYKVLKPGGLAILNTPNRKRLTRAAIEVFTKERQFPWWEHLREYTEKDLNEVIEKSAFKEYQVIPRVFGLHAGPLFVYAKKVPKVFKRYANYWEIQLVK